MEAVAFRALGRLRERLAARGRPARPVCATRVRALATVALDADRRRLTPAAILAELRQSGLDDVSIADDYIPAAARLLGERWVDDRLNFASVTVASGRLQELLAELTHGLALESGTRRGAPRVLTLCPAGDDHTLGWKLVTLQLRRRGFLVEALPGALPREAADAVAQFAPGLVFVSASHQGGLSFVEEAASWLIGHGVPRPPLVLGGMLAGQLDGRVRPDDITAVSQCYKTALAHYDPAKAARSDAGARRG